MGNLKPITRPVHIAVAISIITLNTEICRRAHGAIFDPAHGGAVLRKQTGGQNTKPLPKVAIRIDGMGISQLFSGCTVCSSLQISPRREILLKCHQCSIEHALSLFIRSLFRKYPQTTPAHAIIDEKIDRIVRIFAWDVTVL